MSPLERVLDLLEGVRPSGSGFGARCPGPNHHRGDRHSSLTIAEGTDQPVLFDCKAGCSPEAVLDAIGLSWSDVCAERRNGHVPPRMVARTRYESIDPDTGDLVAVHMREDRSDGSKALWWEQPDGSKGLGGRRVDSLPLYGLAEVARLPAGSRVVLVEGEKAQVALQRQGIRAVGTVTGAAGTPSADVLRPLADCEILLWPDNDDQGRAHMLRVASWLKQQGTAVRWLAWAGAPPKGDAFDFFAGGGTAAQLAVLVEAATPEPAWAPKMAKSANDGQPKRMATLGDFGHLSVVGTVCLADVQPEKVRWCWRRRVPLGKVTVLDGDPGLGKSTLALDLAGRVSTGSAMPDGTTGDLDGPAGVLVLSAEDGLADTIRPRLEAAGADLTRVLALTFVQDEHGERLPTLADLEAVEAAILQVGAAMVIVDPVMAFLPGEVNAHRDQDIRRAIAPLTKLAERTGVAVIIIRHLNKAGTGNPLYRGGGSIGIVAAARAGLLVAKDPDDESGARRILAPTKANLSEEPPSLAYRLIGTENDAVRVQWEGTTEHTASSLLASVTDTADERDALSEATDFLREALGTHERPAEEILREARGCGVAEKTLRRAKTALGLQVRKEGFGKAGQWLWRLPDAGPKMANTPKDGQPKGMGILGVNDHLRAVETCLECGGAFETTPQRYVYCSDTCRDRNIPE